jgi:hypothetical protein
MEPTCTTRVREIGRCDAAVVILHYLHDLLMADITMALISGGGADRLV